MGGDCENAVKNMLISLVSYLSNMVSERAYFNASKLMKLARVSSAYKNEAYVLLKSLKKLGYAKFVDEYRLYELKKQHAKNIHMTMDELIKAICSRRSV